MERFDLFININIILKKKIVGMCRSMHQWKSGMWGGLMSKCWPPWQCLKRFAVIFLVVWHMYTMMRWLNSHELFFSLFSPCKNIKVSFYFIFLSNLIPILLLVICFVFFFIFFYWLFSSISSLIIWFYLIFISNLIIILLIVVCFYPFPDRILFSIPSLSI